MMCPGSSGVEQRTENPRVGSSNLPPGTTQLFLLNNIISLVSLIKFVFFPGK